jgi:uncharacterized membrane protein
VAAVPPAGTSLQRALIALAAGAIATTVLAWFTPWQFSVLTGWCAAAAVFMLRVWLPCTRMSPDHVAAWAPAEDDTRAMASALLLGAAVASIVGVAFALHKGSITDGVERVAVTTAALTTVVFSWFLVNTAYMLRYAHLYYTAPVGGVDFEDGPPDYRDFAYLSFTIGMTYQVSDTGLRTKKFRRTLLGHALLAYLFGAVIIATMINTVAGFVTSR